MTTLGGWCQPAPGCTHTERQHVACRSRVCGCEAFGGHKTPAVERDSAVSVLASGGEVRDNGGTNQDGPGRCANTVIPGPRRSVEGTD